MKVEQYAMAYGVEQDRLRAILPDGFISLRPVHDAHGKSIGRTLPAYAVEASKRYSKEDFTVENAVKIPCKQVLGTYAVQFARDKGQNLWLKK